MSKSLAGQLGPGLRAGFTGLELDLSQTSALESLAADLGLPLAVAEQVHGTKLGWVDQVPNQTVYSAGPCDALATSLNGLALVIRTADCVPILLADLDRRLVAAVHAGWRGVYQGVVQQTVLSLKQAGASRLRAAIGPAICPNCYEVSAKLAKLFDQLGLPTARCPGGRPSLDLPGGVANQLVQVGVEVAYQAPQCTKCSPGFFSFRANQSSAGRQAGWIALI